MLKYQPRGADCGSRVWLCAQCGYVNKHKIRYDTVSLRCRNKECGKVWVIGLLFREATRGAPRTIPPDMTFPVAPIGSRHKPGEPIHATGEPIDEDVLHEVSHAKAVAFVQSLPHGDRIMDDTCDSDAPKLGPDTD